MIEQRGNTMRDTTQLIGRVLLAQVFIIAAIGKIVGYTGTAHYMAAYGVPTALLPLVIALELGAGTALLIGWHTRLAAFALSRILAVCGGHFSSPGRRTHPTYSVNERPRLCRWSVSRLRGRWRSHEPRCTPGTDHRSYAEMTANKSTPGRTSSYPCHADRLRSTEPIPLTVE